MESGYLQITCFSFGSFESSWNVALHSLCTRKTLRRVKDDAWDGAYLFELGVTAASDDVPQYFIESALHFW